MDNRTPTPDRMGRVEVTSPTLVVLAASSGGLKALSTVLSSLPADFPAAIAVVQHRGLDNPELLPELLGRRTELTVRHAKDGDLLEPGTVYVCPPGKHITAEHSVRLVDGPRLNYVRPSVDLMFESVARTYGHNAVVVVLSGSGSDGAVGTVAVLGAGGTAIAQAPSSSAFAGMPTAAIMRGCLDLVLPPEEIGDALLRIVQSKQQCRRRAVSPARTTVLLADDHRIILDGLRALLTAESDLEVIGEAPDGYTAVRLTEELSPDVVVMDIELPELNGIDATQRIAQRNPATRIVGLSAGTDAAAQARMLKAGARGYLSKNAAFAELAVAIRTVAQGGSYPPPV